MKVAKKHELWNMLSSSYSEKIKNLQSAQVKFNKPELIGTPGVDKKKKDVEGKLQEAVELNNEFTSFYEKLSCPPTAENLNNEGFKAWKWIKDFKQDRGQYEAYVIGYLDYFEKHVRSDADKAIQEHCKLYFDWGETRPGEYDLIIYLSPLLTEYSEPADESAGSLVADKKQLSPLAPPPAAANDPKPPQGPPPPPKTITPQ